MPSRPTPQPEVAARRLSAVYHFQAFHLLAFCGMRPKLLMAVLWSCAGVCAQTAPAPANDFAVKKLAEGVYAGINPDGGRAGSNAGFIVGKDCVAVVDTFVSEAAAQRLLEEIRKVTNLPVRFVVNTHYHLDHTGGNKVFSEAGAAIIAHKNLAGWLRTENMKFFPNPTPEQRARVESLVGPQLTYTDGVDLDLGGRAVRVRYFPGHTGGDSVVFVPDANVVFAGDLGWNHHLPNLIDANTLAWIETLDKMLAAHPDATFVPGHGDVATAQDMRDFRDYLAALRLAVGHARAAGKTGDDLAAAARAELEPKYSSWGFKGFMPRNIEQTAAELDAKKKVPVPAGQ
jgi:cyclase